MATATIPCKGVVSTTFDFQRTDVEIIQELPVKQCEFATYQQQTAEDGLAQKIQTKWLKLMNIYWADTINWGSGINALISDFRVETHDGK